MLKPSIEPMCLAVKPIEGRYIDNFEKYGTGLLNCSEETLVDGKFPSNIMTTQEGVLDTTVFMVKKPNKKLVTEIEEKLKAMKPNEKLATEIEEKRELMK